MIISTKNVTLKYGPIGWGLNNVFILQSMVMILLSFQMPTGTPAHPMSAKTPDVIEDSLNSIDNLSVIEEAHQRNSIASSARTVIIKEDVPMPSVAAVPSSAAANKTPAVLPAAAASTLRGGPRKPVALPRFSATTADSGEPLRVHFVFRDLL